MDYLSYVYGFYGLIAVGLTIWLARLLFRNGQVFLDDVFRENPAMSQAVNRLLVVGFYLFNIGYACLLLSGGWAPSLQAAIATLATKLGWLLLSLAFMHFTNLFIFHRIRRRSVVARMAEPPLHHQGVGPTWTAPDATQAPA